MEDDVAAGRPMLAALCVSKMRPSILVCGFFLAAQVLGAFLAIRRARRRCAFHAIELQRVLSFYEAGPYLVLVAS